MCYLVTVNGEGIKKAKGVNRNIVDSMRHKEYVNLLFGGGLMRHNMKRIQSKLYRIGNYEVCKISVMF